MPTLDLHPAYLQMVFAALQRHAPDAEVWAYGSRVAGGAHEGSDLDLVLRQPGQLTQPQKNLARLRDALVESNIPILVEVLDWARIPETFRREIERRHVTLVAAETVVK